MTEKQKQLKISFPHKTKEGYNEQEVWADSRFYNEEISIRKNEMNFYDFKNRDLFYIGKE